LVRKKREKGIDFIMRRKDRERGSAFALEVLRDCEYATLATVNADGSPYCIPISPVLVDGDTVYFHSATEGQKLDNINNNSAVSISCVRHSIVIPEKFTVEYESAVVTGACSVVSDKDEKILALKKLSEKYAINHMNHFDREMEKYFHRTCVCKIDIVQITGKANIK